MDVGDVDSKASHLTVPIGDKVDTATIKAALLTHIPASRQEQVAVFIAALFDMYMDAQ